MSDKKTNVIAVCINSSHTFSKTKQKEIKLIKMIGVEGDAHAGKYVKHLSRVKRDPKAINLRQVHLIQNELFDELDDSVLDFSETNPFGDAGSLG